MSLKRIASVLSAFVAVVVLSALLSVNAFAKGTADFNIPKGAVNKGSEFTVTLSFSADSPIGFVNGMISYDDSVVEFVSSDNASGGGGVVTLNGFPDSPSEKMNVSLNFRAVSGGKCHLDLNNCYITSDDGTQIGSPTAYADITVADNGGNDGENDITAITETPQNSAADEKIGDPKKGYLTSLSVSVGTLKPAFSYDIYDYYIDVDNDVDICEINATTANTTDKIWYTGNEDLAVGKNVRTIKVTDTQGYYHIYTVTITRAEAEEQTSSEQAESEYQPDPSSVDETDSSSAVPAVSINDDDSTNKFSSLITGAMIIVLVTLLIAAAVIIIWLKKKKNNGDFE